MKNLKKLISVVLCLAMLASFMVVGTSAASYGDVDETKSYYAAVELLSSLGILQGDGNGNFNPDSDIKRSEFAAVVSRVRAAANAANGTTAKFDDVTSNHWAVGYIGWAASQGIVNGYGDGTFAPDKAVSYQEAIKMLTAAMGYGPLAESENYGGYPWGYISLASEHGITKGLNAEYTAPASRGLVAQLVYNALEAPLMAQKDTIYGKMNVVYDGKTSECDGEERTLLSQYLDIIKVKANVAGNYKTDNSLWKKNRQPQVELDLLRVENESDKVDYEDDLYVYVQGVKYLRAGVKVYEGATNAASYLAYDVNAYLFYNEDENLELKAIIPDGKSVDTLEVTKDIVVADVTNNGVEFEYWEDIDNDSRTTEVDVAADAVVYVNGQKVGTLDEADAIAAFEGATAANIVLFIGPRGDDFNKVFITEYQYEIVESVDLEEEAIEFKNGYLALSKEARDDKFVYTIYKDGEEIALKDLAENDVLSIVAPGGDTEDALYLDIYVSSKTVTGTVTGAKSGDNNHTYYIDKVEYKTVNANALKVGDEGIFYLTSDGKILDSKATSTLSDNYAYILKAGEDENFGEMTYQLRLFTKAGQTVTYNIASSVKVTEEVEKTVDNRTVYVVETDTLKASEGEQDALYDAIVDLMAAEADEEDAQAKASKRLITFSLSGDEINKISFAADHGEEGKDFNIKSADGSYKASTSKFGGYYFNDTTALFYAPVEKNADEEYVVDPDDVALLSFASLDEDQTYTAYGYAIDDRTMGAATIVNSLGFAGKASALAVVKSVSTGLNAENEEAMNITVLKGGQTATYAVDEDVEELDAVAEGDIIQIVLNGAGEISQAEVVYDGALTAYANGVTEDDSDISFVAGYAVDGGNGELYINDELAEGGVDYGFNYEAGCTLAMVDESKAGTTSYVKALTSTSAVKYVKSFDDEGNPRGDVYYVVARLVEDEIVDVVEYTGFVLA